MHAQHAFHLSNTAAAVFNGSSITPRRPGTWPGRQEPRIHVVEYPPVFWEILTESGWSAVVIGQVFRALRVVG